MHTVIDALIIGVRLRGSRRVRRVRAAKETGVHCLIWFVLALLASHGFTRAVVKVHLGVQENGEAVAVTGPDLTVKLKGLNMPNSFVIGSVKLASVNNFALQNNVHACIIQALTMLHPGPPGTEYAVMKRAFEAGEV